MAEQVINLATFEFDISSLNQNSDKLETILFGLKKDQQGFKDALKETQKEITQTVKTQELLIKSGAIQSEEYKKNADRLKELNQIQLENQKGQSAIANQIKSVGSELTQTNKQLRAYMTSEGEQTNLIDSSNKALATQVTNINQARASNTELLRVRNQLNPAIATEAKLITDLNNKMNANNAFIKENASEYEKQKINIGNYSSVLEGLDGVLAKFGINGQQARTVVSGFTSTISKGVEDLSNFTNSAVESTKATLGFKTSSQLATESQIAQTTVTETQTVANTALATSTEGVAVATTATTLSLKGLTVALASTGIGLIIVGVAALFSYLKDLDPLLDNIEKGFAAVGAVVRVVGSAIANLSFEGLGDSMAKAAKDAIALKEAQQDLADIQNSQEVANAKASQQYDELIVKSKNRTLTEKERIGFLQQAQKIEEANYIQRSNLAQRELDLAIRKATISAQLSEQEIKNLRANTLAYGTYLLNREKGTTITQEELDALKKAELGKIAIDAESTKRLEKNQNAQDKLFEDEKTKREKATADAKTAADKKAQEDQKALDQSIKNMQTELDFYIASQGEKKKSMEEQLSFDKEIMRQALAINKAEYDAKKINLQEFNLANLQTQNDFLAKQTEATIANAQIEFELFQLNNQRKIDANQFYNDELYNQDLARINKQAEAEAAQQTLLFEKGKINAEEYGLAIAQIDDRQRIANETAAAQRQQAEKDKKAADLIVQDQLNSDRFEYDLTLQTERNERERLLAVEDAKKTGADVTAINDLYAKKQIEIERIVTNNKLALNSQALGNIATLLGESSDAGKAVAIAQTTIDTYLGAQKAYTSQLIVGDPSSPVRAGLAAGVAVLSGLANVKKIIATKTGGKGGSTQQEKPKYARGVIGVGTGTSDSIDARLSAGESVLTARASQMFPDVISAINQAGGGVGINGMQGSSSLMMQESLKSNSDNNMNIIAEAVYLASLKGTTEGSSKGIIDLSTNRQIIENAKF